MNWRIKNMIAKKYLRNYSEIILKCLDIYSDSTTSKVSDILTSEQNLLKMENILQTNPTEQEFIKILDNEF